METLPQLPEPYRWTCEDCDGPNYFWDPALRSDDYDQDVPLLDRLRPRLCPVCIFERAKHAGPEERERTSVRLDMQAMEGELLGLPDEATLLAFELPGIEGPFHVLGVGVDWWPLSLPHFVLDWGTPGCAPKILVLRLFISIGWMRGPVWQVRWSWERPETKPTYQLIEGKTAPTPAEWDKLSMALGRFHSIAADARRPRGTGTYPPGKDGDSLFLADIERVLADHEQRGVRINNQEMLADYMPVGKTVLNQMFNRVPTARERFKQHKRSVRRVLRD